MAIAVARDVIKKGAATKNQETTPSSILQSVSNNTTVASPRIALIDIVIHMPNDASNPSWMTKKIMYKRAGGQRSSMKRIFRYYK
jgi:hypothetical protein